jgi:preprotein translocase subunit SecD
MRWIGLFLLLLPGLALPARAGHSPPQVLLRVFVQTTGDGMADTQAHEITIPPDNETILIRAMPETNESEITDVQVDPAGRTHVFFDHTGTVDLDAVTAQNQGRILVVTLDGYIIYAPVIDREISNGELIIPHPIPPQIIQLLQKLAKQNVEKHNAN